VAVLEVDGDGDAGYPNVGAAVADVDDGEMAIIRLHELDGDESYGGAPLIDGGKTVALLAAPGEEPALQGVLEGTPALRIEGPDTTVYVDRLSLRDTAGRGLLVSEGTAWVDHSRIVRNTEGGVLAEADASLTIRSSFVGGSIDDVAAVEVDGATARLVYATLGGGFGNARALVCNASATVEVRNSVLVARTGGPEVQCDGTFERDAVEHALEGTNTVVPPMSTAWFVSYAEGDFRLMPAGAEVFAGIARWRAGDPQTDIDGDARPAVDGAADLAGADVP
jgi:hypothetical protein